MASQQANKAQTRLPPKDDRRGHTTLLELGGPRGAGWADVQQPQLSFPTCVADSVS